MADLGVWEVVDHRPWRFIRASSSQRRSGRSVRAMTTAAALIADIKFSRRCLPESVGAGPRRRLDIRGRPQAVRAGLATPGV